jgi:O-antigen/teichoic acid export membrane protein
MWAILDQALFAVSNFLVNILLARSLPPAEYGAFVTAYAILLLVSVGHTSLLSEPLQVFGAERYRDSYSHYLRVLHRYHWQFMGAMGAGLGILAVGLRFAGNRELAAAVVGIAVAGPCILLSWLARRACYPVLRPQWAAMGGLVNITLIVVGSFALLRLGRLSVTSAQLLIGAAALCAAGGMLVLLGRVTDLPLTDERRGTVLATHWKYARWSGATGVFNWCQGYVFYLVLPIWDGLAATGGLKALFNLVMPLLQSDAALSTLLVPVFVRSRREAVKFTRVLTWSAAAFATEAVLYWFLLVLAGHQILAWLYQGTYQYDVTVLAWLGAVPLGAGLLNVLGAALQAREQPNALFWAAAASVVVAGTVGVAATAYFGVAGAIAGMVGCSAIQIVVMSGFLRRPAR